MGSGASGFHKVYSDSLKKGKTIINNYFINNNFQIAKPNDKSAAGSATRDETTTPGSTSNKTKQIAEADEKNEKHWIFDQTLSLHALGHQTICWKINIMCS